MNFHEVVNVIHFDDLSFKPFGRRRKERESRKLFSMRESESNNVSTSTICFLCREHRAIDEGTSGKQNGEDVLKRKRKS
jgi:hypothetical protein